MPASPRTAAHAVWPEGPLCAAQCPGTWSDYHQGYSDGMERALNEQAAAPSDVERPADDEHAALLLAGAMQEAGFKYDVGAARTILDYLAAPQEGWAPERGWGIARLAPTQARPADAALREAWPSDVPPLTDLRQIGAVMAREEAAFQMGKESRRSLPQHGFAANRPTGPRTMEGHALARNLRDRDPEVDWDAWIRTIEDGAAAPAQQPTAAEDV